MTWHDSAFASGLSSTQQQTMQILTNLKHFCSGLVIVMPLTLLVCVVCWKCDHLSLMMGMMCVMCVFLCPEVSRRKLSYTWSAVTADVPCGCKNEPTGWWLSERHWESAHIQSLTTSRNVFSLLVHGNRDTHWICNTLNINPYIICSFTKKMFDWLLLHLDVWMMDVQSLTFICWRGELLCVLNLTWTCGFTGTSNQYVQYISVNVKPPVDIHWKLNC